MFSARALRSSLDPCALPPRATMEKPSPAPSPPQRSRPGRRRAAMYVPYRRLRERAARLTVTERATHTHISPLVQAGDGPLRLPDLAPAMAADEDRRSPPIGDVFCGNGSSDTIKRAVESRQAVSGAQPRDRQPSFALSHGLKSPRRRCVHITSPTTSAHLVPPAARPC